MSAAHDLPLAANASLWPLHEVVAELRAARGRWRAAQHRESEPASRELPSREVLGEIARALRGALFPLRLGTPDLPPSSEDFYVGYTLDRALNSLLGQVRLELNFAQRTAPPPEGQIEQQARAIVRRLAVELPRIRELLDQDVEAAYAGDPAARSVDEILLCYPGIEAIIHHRLAHSLHRGGAPLLARMLAELAHAETGIDIHPGAEIGSGFFIDHGTGVVIG